MTNIVLATHALLAGRATAFRGDEPSAIAKRALDGPVRFARLGLAGDEQADRVHHGGPDKAVHLYPHDHYPYWRTFMGGHPLLDAPGAFGENISASGADEHALCLGDRFRLGTVLLEISHGRQPCWKIDHRFGRKGVTADIVRTGKCGIYLRVIEEGLARAGDPMTLLDRSYPEWNIARVFALLIGGEGARDLAAVRALAGMNVLADAWRDRAGKIGN